MIQSLIIYRFRFLVLLMAASVFQSGSASGQNNQGTDQSWERYTQLFSSSSEAGGIIGSATALIRPDEKLKFHAYGLADNETRQTVDVNTIFHWASITKTFTSIGIMQLRDEGFLTLDDPIVQFIPEFSRIYSEVGDPSTVTIRHVLSHSSGMRNPTWPWGGQEPWHPHEPTEWEQLVGMFPYSKLHFTPGSQYSYSNPAIILLGRIIEIISGEPYETYIDKNILKPLEMYASYFDTTPRHLLAHRSNNYYLEDGVLTTNGRDFDTGITVSNGGLNAPISDMEKYLRFLIGKDTLTDTARGVLKRSTLQEMWEIEQAVGREQNNDVSMALGFFVLDHPAGIFIGHTGGQKGFISFFYVSPENQTGSIAVWNTLATRSGASEAITRELLATMRTYCFEHLMAGAE